MIAYVVLNIVQVLQGTWLLELYFLNKEGNKLCVIVSLRTYKILFLLPP